MNHPRAINLRAVIHDQSPTQNAWQFLSGFRFYQKRAVGYSPVIRDMMLLRDTIDNVFISIVKDMRADGISWNEIGEAFGMTPQGARQRFARHVR